MVYKNGSYETYDRERILSEFYDASVKSIDYLPDNLRIVMYDRLVNQKKIDDIAIDNNIPVSSVKNWLRKGKLELQEIIKNKYTDLYDMYMEAGICA
jgi:DNA-directed RNA polymerase specialized sigma24 family protein